LGDKFTKIRIGVGRPAPGYMIVNWVLGKIDKVSSDLILEGFEKFVEAAPNIFTDFNEFVRTMNTKKKEKKSEK
jgi:PTH1 family peptidyl-tRNA hydrolase